MNSFTEPPLALLDFNWQDFHFIRPEWLYAIVPLLIIALLLKNINAKKSGWQSIVASHLYQHLVTSKESKKVNPPFYLLALCWLMGCVAMAGPTWQKLPQPVYQVNSGKVLILDMSLSMRSTDITPSRLSRARFKAIDLLKTIDEGEVGLVVYAGDAFTVSPLTSDVSNIISLIPSLRPEIMPIQGSYPIAAFTEAKRLLESAGYTKGEIYWMTDGIAFDEVNPIREFIASNDFVVSILGIGTQEGAPIKRLNGSLLKDSRGNIVIPRLDAQYLQRLAMGSSTQYVGLSIDDSDIKAMELGALLVEQEAIEDEVMGEGDQWQDMGAFVVVLLLPLAAYAFRKGILIVLLSVLYIGSSEPVFAQQTSTTTDETTDSQKSLIARAFENRFFKTKDQLGIQAYEKGDFETAATLFEDPMWQGAAHYEQGNFEAALEQYEQAEGIEADYNKANTLAKLGELQAALSQYEDVLKADPSHQNAQKNKAIVEDLLKQQEQQQQQEEQSNSEEGNGDQQEQSESEQSDSGQSDSEQEQINQEQQGQEQESSQGEQSQQDSSQSQEQANEAEQDNSSEQQNGSEQEQSESQAEQNEEAEQASALEQSQEPLTPEQIEQMQRDRVLLNKVPDDPAFLLQRKMLLESQQRKRERLPGAARKEW